MNHVKSGTVLYVPAPTFQHQVKHGVRTQRSLGQIDLKKIIKHRVSSVLVP